MSFQAYLDAVEHKTGKTPQAIVDEAHARGFGADTATWLSSSRADPTGAHWTT